MIRSMTAFGNAAEACSLGLVAVELRGVNSRFLDLHFRLPDDLRHLETALRERIQRHVSRGKIEIRGNVQRQTATMAGKLNPDALRQLAATLEQVKTLLPEVQAPRLAEVLAWPGVQGDTEGDWDAATLTAADSALEQFNQGRLAEGQRLAQTMGEWATSIADIVQTVESALPQVLTEYRERQARKLRETFDTAFPNGLEHVSGPELSERLAHETALFSLRIDVAEEVARLRSHLVELRQILAGKPAGGERRQRGGAGSAGKRLDFLLQEMNREANTLGSKAGAIEMTRAAVDLKLLIEQLREQAQNIE
ncbi:MAG: YicC family protein [Pigmentiphaga sp.]|nr:YicC family protein [Pigmentiphaga sp.]